METSPSTAAAPAAVNVFEGLLKRAVLAQQMQRSERTIIRYERAGMPFIAVGMARLYDPEKVRAWILGHERGHDAPKRGRPAKRVAA